MSWHQQEEMNKEYAEYLKLMQTREDADKADIARHAARLAAAASSYKGQIAANALTREQTLQQINSFACEDCKRLAIKTENINTRCLKCKQNPQGGYKRKSKSQRRKKSKSQRRKKSKSQRRRKSIKRRH